MRSIKLHFYRSYILQFLAVTGIILSTSSCADDEEIQISSDTSGLTLLHESTIKDGAISFEVYGTEDPFAGFNELFFSVKHASDGSEVAEADLSITPVMQMGANVHGAPVIQPKKSESRKGLHRGGVIFTMPTVEMGSWMLNVAVNINSEVFEISIPLNVRSKEAAYQVQDAKYKTVIHQVVNDEKYFFAYHFPNGKPVIGANEFHIYAFKQVDMMIFSPVNDLDITIDPQMGSMGHGSPNNINPSFKEDGLYSGKVNFTMTGDWAVWLAIKKSDITMVQDVSFYLEF